MPNLPTTPGAPIAESLHLRLMRDILAQVGHPQQCPNRQCRRSRVCCGAAAPAVRPIVADEHLPPCITDAATAFRHNTLKFATQIAACIRPDTERHTEPHRWPEDERPAAELRFLLGLLHRIHSRPGRHPESETDSLAAWAATDPDPSESAACRRDIAH
jgi:hypothetical protein